MRKFISVIVGTIVLFGLTTLPVFSEHPPLLRDGQSHAPAAPEDNIPKPWSTEDLMEMASIYDQQADALQAEAVRLEQEATSLTLRPYMDPKGFRRTSLMHVASTRWKAAKELRELAVMHRAEGERLLALKDKAGG